VTHRMILTALHGLFGESDTFHIIDRRGRSRQGIVKRAWYNANTVDIALIELIGDSLSFEIFMPVNTNLVTIGNELAVMCRRAVGGTDEYIECYEKSNVNAIIPNSSIFHSTYYSEVGMSGCAVVAVHVGNKFVLAGVHVASHDTTKAVETETDARPTKKARKNVTGQRFDDAMMTVNSNIHGHGSYCLICEVARVEGLLDLINTV
jgi:hypothetical protein